jgi:hypothetical protein
MRKNEYSTGAKQASVSQEQVKAKWGSGEYCLRRIELLNEAFRLFYVFRNRIQKVARSDYEAYQKMLAQLEDAGDAGWGVGVDDLDEAFCHLIENKGVWTDEGTDYYFGGKGRVYPLAIVEGPTAACNFLSALDEKLEELRHLLAKYYKVAQSKDPVRSKFKRLKEIAEAANTFCWLWPVELTPEDWYNSVSRVMKAMKLAITIFDLPCKELQPWLERLGKITDWLKQADTAARVIVEGQQAGMPREVAAGWAALGAVVSHVPLLGQFYGAVISGTPGLIGNVRTIFEEHQRRLDAAAAGLP